MVQAGLEKKKTVDQPEGRCGGDKWGTRVDADKWIDALAKDVRRPRGREVKLIVFGASVSTDKLLVELAANAKHEVTARAHSGCWAPSPPG
jgi:hypothetical protein